MVTNNSANNATGASGTVLQGQGVGTASAFSTATYPATASTAGNILTSDGTNFTSQIPTVATNFNTSNTPTGTTSTNLVMLGLGSSWKLTPKTYGNVLIHIDGSVINNTNADGANYIMAFGTGTAPVNGAAQTGTQTGKDNTVSYITGLLTNGVPFSKMSLITGLSPGTAYWFDLQFKAVTGGTVSFVNLTFTAQELMS